MYQKRKPIAIFYSSTTVNIIAYNLSTLIRIKEVIKHYLRKNKHKSYNDKFTHV